jgi:glucose-6-phosphate 1-dehydrogenase
MVLTRLAILGAGGDLTARMLLPALVRLAEKRLLPEGLTLLAVDRDEADTESFRTALRHEVRRLDPSIPPASLDALLRALEYRRADAMSPGELADALDPQSPLAVYLALPPALFAPAARALATMGLPKGSRIVVEKPFGTDLASAEALNRQLREAVPESAVHRIGHFLAKQTVQNLLGLRFANRVFEPLWSRDHVARMEISWDEMLTVEDRGGYYDEAGALRDMIQNHLLQLPCLVAMDQPPTLSEEDLRDRKVDLLRAVRRPRPNEVARRTRRARYTAGTVGERAVPSYADEPDVDPARNTETFAQVTLEVESRRWAGVPFVLRSGKALARDRREIRRTHPRDVVAGGTSPARVPGWLERAHGGVT